MHIFENEDFGPLGGHVVKYVEKDCASTFVIEESLLATRRTERLAWEASYVQVDVRCSEIVSLRDIGTNKFGGIICLDGGNHLRISVRAEEVTVWYTDIPESLNWGFHP